MDRCNRTIDAGHITGCCYLCRLCLDGICKGEIGCRDAGQGRLQRCHEAGLLSGVEGPHSSPLQVQHKGQRGVRTPGVCW